MSIRLPYNAIVFIELMEAFKLPEFLDFIGAILKEYPLEESHTPKSFTDGKKGGVFLENVEEEISNITILFLIHLMLTILSKLLKKINNSKCLKIGNILSKKLIEYW